MSSNKTVNLIPIHFRYANPLLYALQYDHITIQPYWMMIIQILSRQLIQRLWNLYRYQEFLSTIEIGLIRWVIWFQIDWIQTNLAEINEILMLLPKNMKNYFSNHLSNQLNEIHKHRANSEERRKELLKKLKFDIFNFFFHFIPLFGHAIWYCYIQSSCLSAKDATPWNCYNVFGYRLYNYIFVSYTNFFFIFLIKLLALAETHSPKYKRWSLKWFDYKLGLWSSVIVFIFDGFLLLPYIFTNILPMIYAYLFMTIVYGALWCAILIFTYTFLHKTPIIKRILPIPNIISTGYRHIAVIPLIVALGIFTYPILLTTLFNYSQYLYYGDNFIYTMSNEFNTRDTRVYLQVLQHSVNQKLHTSLNFV